MTAIDAVDLTSLVALFHAQRPGELADWQPIDVDRLPAAYRPLLDHHGHMTAVLESYHQTSVDVHIAGSIEAADHYSREVVLVGRGDARPLQYAIVRLRQQRFAPGVWREIRRGDTPLGHILMRHDLDRQVERLALWQVTAGRVLAGLLGIAQAATTFGRTARILCDGRPAIELLEVLAPLAPTSPGDDGGATLSRQARA